MSDRAKLPPIPQRIDYSTLIAAIATGRGAAAEVKHREACKQILAQVYRVVAAVLRPDAPDIGDATQDALMHVFDAISDFKYDPEKPGSPTAWVNTIALRVALDRRQSQRPEEIEDLDDIAEEIDDELDDVLDRAKLARALLEQLDERHRAVLVLRHWSGQTDEEIAVTLRIPLGTVKTRARTAKIKLERYVQGNVHLRHLFIGEDETKGAEA